MATFVDATSGVTTPASTNHVISRPGSTATGNLLTAELFITDDVVVTAPAGWNPIMGFGETPNNDSGHYAWWRIAAGGDPSTWTFTTAATQSDVHAMQAWSGHDPDRPIDNLRCDWGVTTDPITPSIIARRAGTAICSASSATSSTLTSVPGTLTSLFNLTASPGNIGAAAGYKTVSAGGVSTEDFGAVTAGRDWLASVILINDDYTIPTLGSSSFAAAVLALSPAAYWRLADEQGLTADDWAGSNDGTYTGANLTTYAEPIFPGLPASFRQGGGQLGFANLGANFAANVARIALPSVNWWPTTPDVYTIMACFQTDEVNANIARQTIFGASGTAGKPQLEIESDGSLDMIVEGAFRWDSAAAVIAANTAYFVVFTRNGAGNTFAVYLNGSTVTDPAPSTTSQTSGAFVGLIGARTTTTQPFEGRISDVALFTTALSSGNVSALYALLTGTPSAGEPRFAIPAVIG